MGRRRLAALAACCVLLGACGGQAVGGGAGSGGGPAQRAPAPGSRHPGEHDPDRSAAATAAVADCARAAGWDLKGLNVDVSVRGLLIGISYRAAKGGRDAGTSDETVRRCLDRAGVDWP